MKKRPVGELPLQAGKGVLFMAHWGRSLQGRCPSLAMLCSIHCAWKAASHQQSPSPECHCSLALPLQATGVVATRFPARRLNLAGNTAGRSSGSMEGWWVHLAVLGTGECLT